MIREFRKDDIDEIMRIWLETSLVAHDFIDRQYWVKSFAAVRDLYIPKSQTFVYEDKGKIKGFISVMSHATIAALFVDNKYRGQGIGTQLMNFAKTKFDGLELSVYKKNESSVTFYKKSGFKILKERVDEKTKESEYLMKL